MEGNQISHRPHLQLFDGLLCLGITQPCRDSLQEAKQQKGPSTFYGSKERATFAPMDWNKSKGVPDSDGMTFPTPAKRLHEMNALEDMGQFPLVIYAGATGNVLVTLTATWFLRHYTDDLRVLWLWAVGIIALNLSPVAFLRLVLKNTRDTPPIREMNFFRDQHRFASWVYAVASGNLFFWIVTAWCVFSVNAEVPSLLGLLGTALVVTSFPAWIRFLRKP